MSEQKSPIYVAYEFADFRLDVLRRSLGRLDGTAIPLKPKALDILLVLIEKRGELVSKEELLRLAWPDTNVEEGNLMVHMSLLRKALGDNTGQPRFIVTVSGKGYRFIGQARELSERGAESEIVENEVSESDSAIKSDVPLAPGPSKISYTAVFSGVAGALILAILPLWFLDRPAAEAKPFAGLRLTRLTTSGKAAGAALSPDGKYIAYILKDGDSQSVWLRQLNANSDVQIVPPAAPPSGEVNYSGLLFSADGEQLYFVRSEKGIVHSLYRTSKLGGAAEKLDEDVDSTPGLSPDGKTLAYIRGLPDQNETALFTLNTTGDGPQKLGRKLVSLPSAEGFILSAHPSWSPDGEKIVCARKKQDADGKYQGLVLIGARSEKLEDVAAPRFSQISQVAWMPDMKGFLVAGAAEDSPQLGQIWFVSYPGGKARRVTNDFNDYRELSLTADGKTIVTLNTDRQTNIWLVPDPDIKDAAKRAAQITSTNYDGAEGLAWMPNGDLIYASRGSDNFDLWTVAADGAKRQITSGAGNNSQPAVSPDGSKVAFVSDRSGTSRIWLMDPNGSNVRQLTNGVDDGSPNWSPDGRTVIYRSYVRGNPMVFSIASSPGGVPIQLTDKISGRPQFSPDGQKILTSYRPEALAPQRLSIIPSTGGKPETVFDFNSNLSRWAEHGQAILFVNALNDNGVNIWRQPLDQSAAPTPVTDWKDLRIYWFDLSPDGKTLACARGESLSDVVLISDNPDQK